MIFSLIRFSILSLIIFHFSLSDAYFWQKPPSEKTLIEMIQHGDDVKEIEKIVLREVVYDRDFLNKEYSMIMESRPIHIAIKEGRVDVLELLIENFTDLNIRNKLGNTPLHVCALNGLKCVKSEIFFILVNNGAQLDIENKQGDTFADVLVRTSSPQDLLKIEKMVSENEMGGRRRTKENILKQIKKGKRAHFFRR